MYLIQFREKFTCPGAADKLRQLRDIINLNNPRLSDLGLWKLKDRVDIEITDTFV